MPALPERRPERPSAPAAPTAALPVPRALAAMARWHGSAVATGSVVVGSAVVIDRLAGDRGRSAVDEPGDEPRSVVPGAFGGDTSWSAKAPSTAPIEFRWLPALLERRVGLSLVPASLAAPSAVLSDRRRLPERAPKFGRSSTERASATERGLKPAARSALWAARTCGEEEGAVVSTCMPPVQHRPGFSPGYRRPSRCPRTPYE